MNDKRLDIDIITQLIEPRSKVLDLGCGDGDLLARLVREKNVSGQGIEIDPAAVRKCIEKGLNVTQENIEDGLNWYPNGSFDYVILNQSMQQVLRVDKLLEEAFRVGRRVIVGFPNFVYFKARLDIFLFGRVPVTKSLPYQWYDTPNVHFLSIKDFVNYCNKKGYKIISSRYIGAKGEVRFWPNLFAVDAVFLVEKK
jgi:methionine biosynthesis protein MetW